MTKIEEILRSNLTNGGYDPDRNTYDESLVITMMNQYREGVLSEFRKSDEYMELLRESEWLYCLEAAGVDNWEGIDYAQKLLNNQ